MRLATFVIATFLVVPLLTFAHDNHPPGAPDHPIDSPDYHLIDTPLQLVSNRRQILEMKPRCHSSYS